LKSGPKKKVERAAAEALSGVFPVAAALSGVLTAVAGVFGVLGVVAAMASEPRSSSDVAVVSFCFFRRFCSRA
jgi:hypothetical protein